MSGMPPVSPSLVPHSRGCHSLYVSSYMARAMPMERWLERHTVARPAALALPRDGSRIPISKAMMAITTRSSMSVKAFGGGSGPVRGAFMGLAYLETAGFTSGFGGWDGITRFWAPWRPGAWGYGGGHGPKTGRGTRRCATNVGCADGSCSQ